MPQSEGQEQFLDDDVVISGIGGIFPSCRNIDELRESLLKKEDLCTSVHDDINWQRDSLHVSNKIGRLEDVPKFDNMFFGITALQANHMDIMMKKLLERTYEAIIDSGHAPASMKKFNANIYMGTNVNFSEATFLSIKSPESGFTLTGHARCMIANRISYWLNSNGSSISFYAAEPAGLQGITMAYRDIKAGYCDAAIVGTCFILSQPEQLLGYKQMGLLNDDGICKAFDAEADGFSRGEACMVVVLQKAKYAKRIYTKVVHSDYNAYGTHDSLVYPEKDLFRDSLIKFYETCKADPHDVVYLEADGESNWYHDSLELNTVDEVLCSNRKSPLLVGAVKTNLGHTEACSSSVSLAKVVIAMETGLIPANLHYKTPSPLIPALTEGRIKVVTETTKWNGGLAAVNSVGIGGVFAHTLFCSYDKQKQTRDTSDENLPLIICASARNEQSMKNILQKISNMPYDAELVKLIHDLHTTKIANHNYRGYTVLLPSKKEKLLSAFNHYDAAKKPVWFVFSGMGSQWIGMGRDLMKHPILASSLQKCHKILLPKKVDLMNILTGDDPHMFDNILHSFVGIAAIQIALVDFLRALNIVPDGMIGHSVGELGCAYADGCFTLEQMLLAAYYRGLASIETELIHGTMAAIGQGFNEMKDKVPPGIDIACHNSADSCTISGPTETVLSYVQTLREERIFAKAVNVSNIAYHSRYIQTVAPKLQEHLKKIIPEPKPRSSKWVSTSVPENKWGSTLAKYSSAEYHTNNLLSSVLFEEASQYIPKNAITIEIAPHGLLQAILKRSLGKDCINIPLTHRGSKDGLGFLLSAIGKLYIAGIEPHLSNIYPPVEYPVSRGTPSLSFLINWDHEKSWPVPSIDRLKGDTTLAQYSLPVDLRSGDHQTLRGQKINGEIIYPASAFLITLWKLFFDLQRQDPLKHAVVLENIMFYNILRLSERHSITLSFSVTLGCKKFEIYHDNKILVTGLISVVNDKTDKLHHNINMDTENNYELSGKEVYKDLEQKGFQYSNFYKSILNATVGEEGCKARIQWFGDWIIFLDSIIQLGTWHKAEEGHAAELPTYIQKVIIDPLRHDNNCKEFTAICEKATNIIRCGGIEIRGLQTSEVSFFNNRQQINLETIRFLPHDNPCLQNREDFLEIAVQLLLENIPQTLTEKVLTFVELTNNLPSQPLLQEIKDILSHKERIKAEFKSLPVDNVTCLNENEDIAFVLANKNLIEQGSRLLNMSSGFLFVRLPAKHPVPQNNELVTVIEQIFDDEKYVLLKKRISIDLKKTQFIHLGDCSTYWSDKFKNAISSIKSNQKAYIVFEEKSHENVLNFMTELQTLPKKNNIRFIFKLDNRIQWCAYVEPLSHQHLSKDLLINIFSNGTWGSFHQLSIPTVKSLPLNNLLCNVCVEDFDVKYVGLNLKDWCINRTDNNIENKIENLGPLDLSGLSYDGKKVMALSRIDTKKSTVEVDPYFIWTVPNHWSLKDAATVPLAYSLAYYTLTMKKKVPTKPGQTILIHGGHTTIGLAFIAVALQFKCIVNTTVYSNEDMQQVLKRFPQISIKNIIKIDNSFSYKFSKNADVVIGADIISCLKEPFLAKTFQCFKIKTRIFHFCLDDVIQNTEIGSNYFLGNDDFSIVLLEELFLIDSELKAKLHDMVEYGIVSGVVQPLQSEIFTMENGNEFFRSVSHDIKAVVDISNKEKISSTVSDDFSSVSHFSRDNVCLVIGDKPEDCLCVARWLAIKNVKNILMYSKTPASLHYEKRQYRIFQHSYASDARFIYSEETYSTEMITARLIKECMDTAPLETIFLIYEFDQHFLHHLDSETSGIQSLKNFIYLASDCPRSITSSQRKRGITVVDIKWSGHQTLQQVLPALDSVLPDPPVSTVYVTVKDEKSKDTITPPQSDKLHFLLPSSLKELEHLGRDVVLQKTSPFVELPSQSPALAYVKEILPIFIIPGLKGSSKKMCKQLARILMYPVILLRIPPGKTIVEMAKTLVKHMKTVQPDGPYNIVGLPWSGALTFQVAQELLNVGEKTQVYWMDTTPQITQRILRQLGEGSQLQVNLIMYLLGIKSKKIQDDLINMKNWEDQLEHGLSVVNIKTPEVKSYVLNAMNMIHDGVKALLNYEWKEVSLNKEIFLIQSEELEDVYNKDADEIPNYKANIYYRACNHEDLYMDKTVAQIICENALDNVYIKMFRKSKYVSPAK